MQKRKNRKCCQSSKTTNIVHRNHNNHQIASSKFIASTGYYDNSMDQEIFCDVGDYQCKQFHSKDRRDNDTSDMLILRDSVRYSGKQNAVT